MLTPNGSRRNGARASEHPKHVWDARRERFTQLYRDEGKKLAEVQQILEHELGFFATQRQYKRKIKLWGLEKNIKAEEKRDILLNVKLTSAALQGERMYTLYGKAVAAHKLRRYWRSHGKAVVSSRALPASDGLCRGVRRGDSVAEISRSPSMPGNKDSLTNLDHTIDLAYCIVSLKQGRRLEAHDTLWPRRSIISTTWEFTTSFSLFLQFASEGLSPTHLDLYLRNQSGLKQTEEADKLYSLFEAALKWTEIVCSSGLTMRFDTSISPPNSGSRNSNNPLFLSDEDPFVFDALESEGTGDTEMTALSVKTRNIWEQPLNQLQSPNNDWTGIPLSPLFPGFPTFELPSPQVGADDADLFRMPFVSSNFQEGAVSELQRSDGWLSSSQFWTPGRILEDDDMKLGDGMDPLLEDAKVE